MDGAALKVIARNVRRKDPNGGIGTVVQHLATTRMKQVRVHRCVYRISLKGCSKSVFPYFDKFLIAEETLKNLTTGKMRCILKQKTLETYISRFILELNGRTGKNFGIKEEENLNCRKFTHFQPLILILSLIFSCITSQPVKLQ